MHEYGKVGIAQTNMQNILKWIIFIVELLKLKQIKLRVFRGEDIKSGGQTFVFFISGSIKFEKIITRIMDNQLIEKLTKLTRNLKNN